MDSNFSYTLPILEKELKSLKRAYEKSVDMYYKKKIITLELHQTHIKNLNPKITELKKAIIILKTWK